MLDILKAGSGSASAIGAPERPPLSYDGLRKLAGDTIATLNGMGIGRNDRVAIVLPNGPEMATAFVTIAGAATTAPLNPAYRADEFEFYLSDLDARALVLDATGNAAAEEVAARLKIPVIRLEVAAGVPAGTFTLRSDLKGAAAHPGPSQPGDTALVLHTSGTTSRPKIVPLTVANLTASARNIRASLQLTPADRCLNIMPLFHIHGLIAAVSSSLSAGASVICTPGFNALKFFQWLDEAKPTWYTAVPTMHQAILARAPRNQESVARAKLRFIRSSSSSLPPRQHKAGSVGLAAGPEMAILAPDGRLCGPGEVGEICIRGDNVTAGYEKNPKANGEAFAYGWFHTGDQGTVDEEGYYRITGRLKEIINRGGEKISPREVDEVIMDHPAVAQVVTFGMPHAKLGEEVAAVVVLREGQTATERDIREFCATRLADFKVPRKVLFMDEIPKGATGKLQRIGLAEKLGLSA